MKEEYEAKEGRMQKYLRLTKHLTQEFDRSQNMIADEIAKVASSEEGSIRMGSKTEIQKHPSIKEISTFVIQSTRS